MKKTTPYARRRARQTDWQRARHKSVNPVKEAIIKAQIVGQVESLRLESNLQAFAGGQAAKVCNSAGRLVYVVAHAARAHGLESSPEARILAGTAGALGDIADSPGQLEMQRGAVIAGLDAIDRLMPHLHPMSLAMGALELDQLLSSSQGLGTAEVRQALGMGV
jgi:hypothetical protein